MLKFKVDYNDVRPKVKAIETEQDEKKLTAAENGQALQHPDRIAEISQYILDNYRRKTHRLYAASKGFNALFAVSSVDAAKLYYESLNTLQADSDKRLKIATKLVRSKLSSLSHKRSNVAKLKSLFLMKN